MFRKICNIIAHFVTSEKVVAYDLRNTREKSGKNRTRHTIPLKGAAGIQGFN